MQNKQIIFHHPSPSRQGRNVGSPQGRHYDNVTLSGFYRCVDVMVGYNHSNPSGFSNENEMEYRCKQSRRDAIFIANEKYDILQNAEGVTLL
jgi:hypothetical protein